MGNQKKVNEKQLTLYRRLIAHLNPKSPSSEQYRTLRSNIQFSSIDQEMRTIVMTSAGPGEGKSTTAANLAIVYAQQGSKVLLVDADLRKPTVHYSFKLENYLGLTNLLTRQKVLSEVINSTTIDRLFVLTSGPIPPNPSELLSSNRMGEVLSDMKEQFDYIIFDTPPVLAVTDAQILSNKVDGTILVVSSRKTEKDNASKARDLLNNANAHVIGAVLNNMKIEKGSPYYYYYGN